VSLKAGTFAGKPVFGIVMGRLFCCHNQALTSVLGRYFVVVERMWRLTRRCFWEKGSP